MYRLVLAGLLPVVLAASVEAQFSAILTEEAFLSVLDANHPAVVERAEIVAMARASVGAAAAFDNPVLAVEREDPSGSLEQTDWILSWQLPDSSRRLRIAVREEEVATATAHQAQDLLSLRLAMREVYAQWAIAAARRQRLSVAVQRVEALAARQSSRAQEGEAPRLEARRLALMATSLNARVTLAAAASDAARARAASWHPDLPAASEPLLPRLPPPPLLLATEHPLLRAAQAEVEAANLARQAAKRFLPSPAVTVGWQRQEDGSTVVDGPLFGLVWSVPLLARNQAERTQAEARAAAARARLESVRREIAGGRQAALTSYKRLTAAVTDATAATADNGKMRDGAEAAFHHGEADLADLLETLRSTSEAEMAVLDLYQAALAAHRQLERFAGSAASGDPPPPSHVKERLR